MRKLTLADYLFAALAVGIMIGFPVWHWISGIPLLQSRLPRDKGETIAAAFRKS
jgi:hypothetical protein